MGRLISVFLLSVVVFLATYVIMGQKEIGLYSPIPKIFGITSKQEVANGWFPKVSSVSADKNLDDLNLSAKSALVVNYDSGEVVYAKNAKEKLPVASTVKIMTALVALGNKGLDDTFTVSAKAAHIGEDSMGLTEGEKVTLKELLYGLMLVSGNDAAITIAEGVAQNELAFVDLMNKKARSLGLSDTEFINASGLDEDGKVQYSTAYDMATIARYAWENFAPFRQGAQTEHIVIGANANHKEFDFYNDTNLLTTYPGVKGIKPGFTWEAGLCLVTYAENKQSLRSSALPAGLDGKKLLAVVLGSDNRRGEMKELLDYGFSYYGIKVSHPALDL